MGGAQRNSTFGLTQSAAMPPFPAFLVLNKADAMPSSTADRTSVSPNTLAKNDYHQQPKVTRVTAFSDLPAEVRLEIFERCVSPIRVQSPFDHQFKKITAASQRFNDYFLLPVLFADSSFPVNLLLLSKRIASEAQDAVYRKVSFELIATHARYMFAYTYYLTEHPMRLTERLTLRILHDIWTSRNYGGIPRLRRAHWETLSRLVADMPNIRRLTVRVVHCSQNEDVDSFAKYTRDGIEELGDGLAIMQRALQETSVKFRLEFAAPESDYTNPEHREWLVAMLRDKGLPVSVDATCSWVKVCTQDAGAYIWSPVASTSDISKKGADTLDAKEPPETTNIDAIVSDRRT